MSWETKEVVCGLLDEQWYERSREQRVARERDFPCANTWLYGGCNGGMQQFAMVRYCRECRAAEKRWNDEHPHATRTPSETRAASEDENQLQPVANAFKKH
jgi:hypothetical protein